MKAKVTYIKNENTFSEEIDVLKEVYMAHRMNENEVIDAIEEMYSNPWMPEFVSAEIIKEEKAKPATGRVRYLGYGEDERGGIVYVNRA